jgi:alpha-beta hydrolase superfamily lysophospholipase
MQNKAVGRRQRHWGLGTRLAAAILLAGFLGLNGIAWMQARAMTHYVAAGQRTAKPEQLSLLAKMETILTGVTIPRPENTQTPSDYGLTFTVQHIAVGAGEQLEAWTVLQVGSDPIVLLFPGYAASKETLLPAAVALHRLGYSTLLVDFRGVGGSSGADTTLGVREATDVVAAVAYAQQTWPGRALVLYGFSMGTAAILRAVATAGVQPTGIILESPFDRLLTTTGNRFHALGLPAVPGAALLVFWGSVQQGFNGFTHNPVEYAPAVRCPTLVLYGAHDPRVTLDQARTVYTALGGPKQFVTFPDAGHDSVVTNAPDAWSAQVGPFLASIGATP